MKTIMVAVVIIGLAAVANAAPLKIDVAADSDHGATVTAGVDLLALNKKAPEPEPTRARIVAPVNNDPAVVRWWNRHPVLAPILTILGGLVAVDQLGVWDVDGAIKDVVGNDHGGNHDDEPDVHDIKSDDGAPIIIGDNNTVTVRYEYERN